MENYKDTHYLFCLYVKFPCHYVFIFVKNFSWEILLCALSFYVKQFYVKTEGTKQKFPT